MRAYGALLGGVEVFSFTVYNYFKIPSDPPVVKIIASYLNGVFEEIIRLAPQAIEQSRGAAREAWQFLLETSTSIVRLKLYWLKLYSRQNPRNLVIMMCEMLMSVEVQNFPSSVRFGRLFKKSLIDSINFFKNQPDNLILPVHNLSLFPLEGLLEGFKLIRNHDQVLTQDSVTQNLLFISRGVILRNERSSCVNGETKYTPNVNF